MILVTGATGNNGRALLPLLLAAGAPVRALTRAADAAALPPGVEAVAGDFDRPETLAPALAGVERAFLVTNSTARAEAQQLAFVAAARAAGVRHVVYLSQLHAAADSPVRFLRYHAVVERALEDSGMAYTHLRPNLYMQSLLAFHASIVAEGRFTAPAGDARVSVVDVRDIAAVAARALTEGGHEGKTYDLTGPEALTHGEMAARIGEALGKPVAYVDVPDAAMRDAVVRFGMPAWQADGLIEDYAHYRRGEAAAVSPDVERVTGRPARTFDAFARESAAALSQ
ncbi:NAD(P)-dependent oxidoreductase [Gemmatimonadetes bacterium T265]|nr:NAD(P)-dependent oxidoreductase [Gemmatimonadetes bacterium T265]